MKCQRVTGVALKRFQISNNFHCYKFIVSCFKVVLWVEILEMKNLNQFVFRIRISFIVLCHINCESKEKVVYEYLKRLGTNSGQGFVIIKWPPWIEGGMPACTEAALKTNFERDPGSTIWLVFEYMFSATLSQILSNL